MSVKENLNCILKSGEIMVSDGEDSLTAGPFNDSEQFGNDDHLI